MKRVIDGRVYDTATGELIHEVSRGHPGDFAYFEEGLYQSPKGQYFLAGHGGPATHYARAIGNNSTGGGRDLRLLTADEARDWLEANSAPASVIAEYFPVEVG